MKSGVLILLSVAGAFNIAEAQSSAHTADTIRTSTTSSALQFSLKYKSDCYYMGRADSAKSPSIPPPDRSPRNTSTRDSGIARSGRTPTANSACSCTRRIFRRLRPPSVRARFSRDSGTFNTLLFPMMPKLG